MSTKTATCWKVAQASLPVRRIARNRRCKRATRRIRLPPKSRKLRDSSWKLKLLCQHDAGRRQSAVASTPTQMLSDVITAQRIQHLSPFILHLSSLIFHLSSLLNTIDLTGLSGAAHKVLSVEGRMRRSRAHPSTPINPAMQSNLTGFVTSRKVAKPATLLWCIFAA